ncbi:hypothetical protein BZA77DRAFT_344348, partial [Pyronema omphalodes]
MHRLGTVSFILLPYTILNPPYALMEPDRERHRRQYPKWKSSSEFASNDDRNYDNSQPVARPTPGIIPHTTIPTPASAPTSTPIPTSKSFHIQPRAPQQIRTQTIT